MKRIHPKPSCVSALAIAAVACAGCQTHSSSVPNPFLAPNRIPPPATRAPLPGQAQPYYPGDPLPVMHSQTAPIVDGGGLAWSAPSGGAPPAPVDTHQAPVAVRGAHEAAVAIPADDDSLRFALPAPAPIEPPRFVPQSPSSIQFAASPPALHQVVSPASYEATAPQPYNPWRAPTVPSAPLASVSLVPSPATQGTPAPTQAPMVMANGPLLTLNTMDVRLRAVSSAPPRIRLPDDSALQSGQDGFRPRGRMR